MSGRSENSPHTNEGEARDMSDDKHAADIHNVVEGDEVTLTNEEHETIALTCTSYDKHNARDPDVVRTDLTWRFEDEYGEEYMLQITEGLRRFEWEDEYPRHKPLYNVDAEESWGHAHIVKIHGKMEA